MTKSISCADVAGDSKCSWSASAESEEELMSKIQAHGKEHGFDQIPDELLAKIKGSIKEQ